MRFHLLGVTAMVSVMAAYGPALAADDTPVFRLTLKDHKFDPPQITVPPGKRLLLIVRNGDDTPAEFESSKLGVEKVISAGREATIRLGPLTPGEYPFIDEFHQDLAKGVLIVSKE